MSFARISIAAFAVVAALLLPGFAGAASCPAGSAVCVYTQDPPTGTGTTTKHKTVPLTSKGTTGLRSVGQRYRPILKNVATKSDYGAPVAKVSLFNGNSSNASVGDSSVGGSLRAAIGSPGAGSENRLIGLLVVIVAITATPAILGFAAARKRRA